MKRYGTSGFTTVEGITGILNDVQDFAPAPVYAMIIGSHGMGWLPVDGTQAVSYTHLGLGLQFRFTPLLRSQWVEPYLRVGVNLSLIHI